VDNLSRRSVLIGGLAGFIGFTVGACGADEEDGRPKAPRPAVAAAPGTVVTGRDGVQQVTVQVSDDYVFTPTTVVVVPGQVRLTVLSVAEQLTHGFRFTSGNPQEIAEEVPVVGPGRSETIEFRVGEPGDYQFECSFHVGMGQTGVMTVGPE
jgi:plastocyanin